MGSAVGAHCVENNGLWEEGHKKGQEAAQKALHFMSRVLKGLGGLQKLSSGAADWQISVVIINWFW